MKPDDGFDRDTDSINTLDEGLINTTSESEASPINIGIDAADDNASTSWAEASSTNLDAEDTRSEFTPDDIFNILGTAEAEDSTPPKNEEFLKQDMDDDWKSQYEVDDDQTKIFFFGRTDREKEDWFRRFAAATHKGAFVEIPKSDVDKVESISDTLVNNAALQEEYCTYMQTFQKVKPHLINFKFMAKSTINPIVRSL